MSPLISSPHEPGPSTSSFSTKVGTVCVLGLSGPEQEKGALGIGKSTLCNRMVRPNFVDFSGEHINCLSQADFLCSPVINGNHWLYWGEVELEREWKMEANSPLSPRRVTHLRVLEQTVFVDDEGFEPLGTTFRRGKVGEDYLRKALALQLESAGKVAYQSRDQLGQEGDFVWQELPGGQINVDAFCVLFDVSFVPGRCPQRQSAFVSSLLLGAFKTKKPVFLVGTKFDECSAEGKAEWQKILGRRELKNAAQNVQMVEISALENVNVAELVWAIGDCLERGGKSWSQRRIPPYPDSLQMRRIQIEQINGDFRALLDWALPREEYLVKKDEISWSRLLADGTLSTQPGYIRFIREFGPKAAKCAFNEHLRASREWWFDHELSVRLCSLRDVLRRMFSRSFLCQIRWPRLVKEIEVHPEFDTFFQPLGRSLDRFSTINDQQWDERLPSEMLQKGESERIFGELQRELLDEIALERQADKFRQILAQKEAVTPGRSFSDAKVMVEEMGAFEQALPPGTALRIYEQFQEEIIQRAQRELMELLMEQIELFVDIVVLWRSKHPELPPLIGLDGKENAAVHSILMEDKRYRMLNGLPDLRATLIGQFASFLSLPLERHCPGGSLCADLGASVLLQRHIQNSSSNFFAIELSLHGPPQFTSQLLNAIRCHTGPSPCPVFLHNGLSIRFSTPRPHSPSSLSSLCSSSSSSCPSPSAGPSLSARIPSQLFLFSTLDEAQQHFLSANLANPHQLISRPSVGGICPLVILIGNMAKMDAHNGQMLQQIGNQLADHLGGMFKMLPLADGPEGDQCAFSRTHLDLLLHEICALQLDSGHSDLRVRVSSMCGDSPSIESILSPLLDHSHLPIDHSGRKFYFDAHLPIGAEMLDENGDPSISPKREMPSPTPSQSLLANLRLPPQNRCKARVCISIGSFHQWILAKWPLQSVQGHLLIFSPSRRASWRQAQCAAKLLLDSVGHGANGEMGEEEDQERKAMGRSIFLVALADANSIDEKRSSRILAKAEHFADRIGAMFASFRSNGRIATGRNGQQPHQHFVEFFQRILQNPFPPAEYYTITSRRIINLEGGEDWHSIAQSQFGICSTLTGSAETLMTERSEGEERETKNAQWRRKSKQSRIALVGSPPPPAAMSGRKKIPPPVLRNDSQLSRTTAMTQWTNGSGLTTSTLTGARGEINSRGSNSSTTRTPLASSNGARGERPHSAVILPSNLEEEEVQQIEANQNAKTPRRLEKLISSFVQFRSTTPVIPLTADDQSKEGAAMGGPTAGSRRGRMQRMASEQQMAKKILHAQIGLIAKKNSIGLPSSAELLSQSMDSLLIMENSRRGQKNENIKLEINEKGEWTGRRRRSRSEMPQKWNWKEQFPGHQSPFFVRRILPSNWKRKRQMPRMLTGRKGQWGNGTMGAGRSERTAILDLEAEDDLEMGKKANPNSPSPHPQMPSSGHRFAWLRSPRSQSRSRGQNAKCSQFSAANNPSQSALSPSTLSSDATPKSGKQQQNSSLAECCAQSREGLPPFMVKCVRTIEEVSPAICSNLIKNWFSNGGLETEGLYRVPGNQMDVERMFQKGGAGNFNKIPVHAVATGLKRFLDGLAEPLIPEKMHSAILNVFEGENGIGEAIDGKKRTQIVAAIRCNLPLENWRVLCFLTGHLRRVAECSAENSMDLRNLAKVWSPTLFRPNFESFEAMASSMAKFEMATFLLLFTNCDKQMN